MTFNLHSPADGVLLAVSESIQLKIRSDGEKLDEGNWTSEYVSKGTILVTTGINNSVGLTADNKKTVGDYTIEQWTIFDDAFIYETSSYPAGKDKKTKEPVKCSYSAYY